MEINVEVTTPDLSTVIGTKLGRYIGDGDYEEGPQTLGDLVAERIAVDLREESSYGELRQRVHAIRDEEIRALVKDQLTEAMNAPLVTTSNYGEPVGKPTTLRELIVAEAHGFFTKKSGQYNAPQLTAADRIIASLVESVVTRELAGLISEEKKRVVEAVRGNVAKTIAEAVERGLRA